jgi:hypothetical protein
VLQTTTTVSTGYVPHKFQREIHAGLRRFSVVIAHRRFGKTVLAVNTLVDAALRCRKPDGRFSYIAPFRSQAKAVAWDYLKKFALTVPGTLLAEADLSVEFPNKARVRLYGSDNPDSMRGLYFDGAVLDEVADMRPETWGEVVRPALSDRLGWCLFIGTPKGPNLLHDLFLHAQEDPSWFAGFYPVDETNLIAESELELARSVMSANSYRQEFLCDFTASSDNVLIPVDLASDAARRTMDERMLAGLPKILGVDVARFGSDRSVIIRRCGLAAYTPLVFEGMDNMALVGRVVNEIAQWEPDAVFVDAGRGEGVIDRLRQLGHDVVEVNFGGKPDNPRYNLKRTEMWDTMAKWLRDGGCLPPMPELKADLCGPTYSFSPSNQMVLESKDHMKERGLRSCDIGDALALTFAYPVSPAIARHGPSKILSDYNPYEVA